jgi:hypothetical protein
MKRIALLLALGIFLVGTANASITPVLTVGPVPVGIAFEYTYTAGLSPDESLNPVATNGVTCPGSGSTLVQCSPPGTFFTIYDVPGLESASVSAPGWFVSVQPLGSTPSTILPPDNPTIENVTFTYTGPLVTGLNFFSGFEITSSDDGLASGIYTDQATLTSNSLTTQGLGTVMIPAPGMGPTPEPGSVVLAVTGLLGLSAATRRRLRS